VLELTQDVEREDADDFASTKSVDSIKSIKKGNNDVVVNDDDVESSPADWNYVSPVPKWLSIHQEDNKTLSMSTYFTIGEPRAGDPPPSEFTFSTRRAAEASARLVLNVNHVDGEGLFKDLMQHRRVDATRFVLTPETAGGCYPKAFALRKDRDDPGRMFLPKGIYWSIKVRTVRQKGRNVKHRRIFLSRSWFEGEDVPVNAPHPKKPKDDAKKHKEGGGRKNQDRGVRKYQKWDYDNRKKGHENKDDISLKSLLKTGLDILSSVSRREEASAAATKHSDQSSGSWYDENSSKNGNDKWYGNKKWYANKRQ